MPHAARYSGFNPSHATHGKIVAEEAEHYVGRETCLCGVTFKFLAVESCGGRRRDGQPQLATHNRFEVVGEPKKFRQGIDYRVHRHADRADRPLGERLDTDRQVAEAMECADMFCPDLVFTEECVDAAFERVDSHVFGEVEKVLGEVLDEILLDEVLQAENYRSGFCFGEVGVASRSPICVNKLRTFRVLTAMVKFVTIGEQNCVCHKK